MAQTPRKVCKEEERGRGKNQLKVSWELENMKTKKK